MIIARFCSGEHSTEIGASLGLSAARGIALAK